MFLNIIVPVVKQLDSGLNINNVALLWKIWNTV